MAHCTTLEQTVKQVTILSRYASVCQPCTQVSNYLELSSTAVCNVQQVVQTFKDHANQRAQLTGRHQLTICCTKWQLHQLLN